MQALEVKPIFDAVVISRIYSDQYISKIGHDHRAASYIDSPYAKYFGAYLDGEIVGAFLTISSGDIEVDIHSLLTKNAIRHSRDFGKMVLDAIFCDPVVERITAYIMQGFEATKNYCLKLGFIDEGMRRNACQKNGKLIGVYTLGMTREDWNKKWVL